MYLQRINKRDIGKYMFDDFLFLVIDPITQRWEMCKCENQYHETDEGAVTQEEIFLISTDNSFYLDEIEEDYIYLLPKSKNVKNRKIITEKTK